MRFGAVPLFLLLLIASLLLLRHGSRFSLRFNLPSVVTPGFLVCLIGAALAIAPAALRGTMGLVQVLRAAVLMPPTISGPYRADSATITLAADADGQQTDRRPINLRLWYPADLSPVPARTNSIACRELDSVMRLPKAPTPYPFLLFAPWLGGKADMASLLTSSFARHGYVVAGIDDPAVDAPAANASAADEEARLRPFDFTSQEQYQATLQRGTLRAEQEAAWALEAADRLAACVQASPALRDRIDFTRIGFVGYSFGAAAAAEASFLDSRIAAVVNLDGSQFGRAGENPVPVPYFVFFSDFDPKIVSNLNTPRRYEFMIDQRDYRRTDEQLKRPDSYAFIIRGSFHDTFADPSPFSERTTLLTWLLLDPYRAHEIVQTYLLGFLDAYVKGDRRGLIGPHDPRYPEVRPFHW